MAFTERFNEFFTKIKDFVKRNTVLSGVIGAIAIIVIALIVVFAVSSHNDPLSKFMSASSKAIDSGSMNFDISVKYNDEDYLKYEGAAKFDSNTQRVFSSYTGVRQNYTYNSVTFSTNGKTAYTGNYYKKKWIVEDISNKLVDFYDFYTDYRNYKIDGYALVSFLELTGSINPSELQRSQDKIVSELLRNKDSILHYTSTKAEDGTLYSFEPDLYQTFSIVAKHTGPVFMSAMKYLEFTEKVEANKESLSAADFKLSYLVDKEGRLIKLNVFLNIDDSKYDIEMNIRDFGNATIQVPKAFFKEIEEEIDEEYINSNVEVIEKFKEVKKDKEVKEEKETVKETKKKTKKTKETTTETNVTTATEAA